MRTPPRDEYAAAREQTYPERQFRAYQAIIVDRTPGSEAEFESNPAGADEEERLLTWREFSQRSR